MGTKLTYIELGNLFEIKLTAGYAQDEIDVVERLQTKTYRIEVFAIICRVFTQTTSQPLTAFWTELAKSMTADPCGFVRFPAWLWSPHWPASQKLVKTFRRTGR